MTLNQVEEDVTLNPQEGEDDVDKYFEDEPEKESPKEKPVTLDDINAETGKKFSKEELVKYIKQVDKDYAQGKVKPVEVKPEPKAEANVPANMEERLLKVEEPLSLHVIDEMKKISDKTGQSLDELWNDESGYFKGKAQAIDEKAKAAKRISAPSGIDGQEEDSEEKKMSRKFMKDFPKGVKIPKLNN